MLVLSRERGESIIAGDITITLVDVRSLSKVRLGIDAPREVPVHRKEVADAIIRESGPFPETRRVPVELLRRIAARLALVDDGKWFTEREELSKIIYPPR